MHMRLLAVRWPAQACMQPLKGQSVDVRDGHDMCRCGGGTSQLARRLAS